jgi:hypothetical protein
LKERVGRDPTGYALEHLEVSVFPKPRETD